MGSARKTILLADDDPGLLEASESFLARPDVEIRRAASGNEAIAAIRGGLVPDVILSDLNMPDGTGIDLLRFVRDHRATSRVPLVILSGSTRVEEIDAAHRLGCTAFLPKPVSCLQLLDKVAECLEMDVRSENRHGAALPGVLELDVDSYDVVTRDVSNHGLCFETRARLEVGTKGRVVLIPAGGCQVDRLELELEVVRVTWREDHGGRVYCYGAAVDAVHGRWDELVGSLDAGSTAPMGQA